MGIWGPDDKPAVLAIHGITANHLSWALVADALPDVRLIAPDLRGRGRSSELPGPWGMSAHAEDVAAVIETLTGGPVPIVGHSMGAFVAVAVCVLVLRRREPEGRRPFRTPLAWVVAPGAILGCLYLFTSLQSITQISFFIWNGIGLLIYFLYARRRASIG